MNIYPVANMLEPLVYMVLQHLDHFKLDLLKTRPSHIWTKKLDQKTRPISNSTTFKLDHRKLDLTMFQWDYRLEI